MKHYLDVLTGELIRMQGKILTSAFTFVLLVAISSSFVATNNIFGYAFIFGLGLFISTICASISTTILYLLDKYH